MKNFSNIFLLTISLTLFCCPSFAKELVTIEKALGKIYKELTKFEKSKVTLSEKQISNIETKSNISFEGSHSVKIIAHVAYKNDSIIGYAFEDTVMGKWGPIHYLLGLDPKGTVLEVIILDYQEIRGRPIAKRRFLRQYKHKTISDPVLLRKDIDGVTGADDIVTVVNEWRSQASSCFQRIILGELMQTIIVISIVIVSALYLICNVIKSIKKSGQKNCSGCSED